MERCNTQGKQARDAETSHSSLTRYLEVTESESAHSLASIKKSMQQPLILTIWLIIKNKQYEIPLYRTHPPLYQSFEFLLVVEAL